MKYRLQITHYGTILLDKSIQWNCDEYSEFLRELNSCRAGKTPAVRIGSALEGVFIDIPKAVIAQAIITCQQE